MDFTFRRSMVLLLEMLSHTAGSLDTVTGGVSAGNSCRVFLSANASNGRSAERRTCSGMCPAPAFLELSPITCLAENWIILACRHLWK